MTGILMIMDHIIMHRCRATFVFRVLQRLSWSNLSVMGVSLEKILC